MATLDRAQVIEFLTALSPDEMEEVIDQLEDRLGVERLFTGWNPWVTMGAPPDPDPEQTEFDVVILHKGESLVRSVKALRSLYGTMALKDARDLLVRAPVVLEEAASRERAEELCAALVAAGIEAELR